VSDLGEQADKAPVPVAVQAPPQPVSTQAPRRQLPAVPAARQFSQELMQRTLPLARYRLMRLGWPGLSGLVMTAGALAAAIFLLLPAHRSITDLSAQLAQSARAAPLVAKPEQSLHQFASSLPTRDQVPAVLGVLVAQAAAAGVALDQGRYSFSPPTTNRLGRYLMEFPVKGDYANVRNFIDRSLKEVPALGLDKLHVERKNVGDMAVSADVGFVIYLRGT